MAILFTFLLGIGNFALHGAVFASGHPLLGKMPWFYHAMSRRFSMAIEFLMLFAGLLLASEGQVWAVVGYLVYSFLNSIAAWLIITGRV